MREQNIIDSIMRGAKIEKEFFIQVKKGDSK